MAKITYTDKVALNENTAIQDINKVKAEDLNEIKTVVNTNDDETTQNTQKITTIEQNIGDLTSLNTTNKENLVDAINEVNTNYKETELYNSDGVSSQVTLSDSVQNYKYIEIFFRGDNDNAFNSVKVYQPHGKNVALISMLINLEAGQYQGVYFRLCIAYIDGNKITPTKWGQMYNGGGSVGGTNFINITRVVGYK